MERQYRLTELGSSINVWIDGRTVAGERALGRMFAVSIPSTFSSVHQGLMKGYLFNG